MIFRFLLVTCFFLSSVSYAQVDEYQLEQLVGWTLISSKQIQGHRTKANAYTDSTYADSFVGCDYDMSIYFSDGSGVTCNSYGYQYAFMPKAFVFGKSVSYKGKQHTLYKMLVNNQIYDIR